MTTSEPLQPEQSSEGTPGKQKERRALGVACAGHVLHDGYTDLIWVALPIWQAEFALSYVAVGTLRMIYTGTMAGLQILAGRVAERLGAGAVLEIEIDQAGRTAPDEIGQHRREHDLVPNSLLGRDDDPLS